MLAQKIGTLDHTERGQGADVDATVGLRPDAAHRRDSAKVEHVLRLEKLLPHGGNQIRAASQHAKVPRMLAQVADRFFDAVRPQQLEFWQAQSAPPVAEGGERREGSSACRSGPFPLKQSAPPCSRKCVGEVGSTPSVRFNTFAFFFARNAARTLSGVNG